MSGLLLADSYTLSQVWSQSSTKNSQKSHFHARNDSSEELEDRAENTSGESEVSVRVQSWHGTPWRLPVTVTGKTASKSCRESLCPSYNEGPLSTAEKFGVVKERKHSSVCSWSLWCLHSQVGAHGVASPGCSGLRFTLFGVCISKCAPSMFVP